jgi:hypothetical protein
MHISAFIYAVLPANKIRKTLSLSCSVNQIQFAMPLSIFGPEQIGKKEIHSHEPSDKAR